MPATKLNSSENIHNLTIDRFHCYDLFRILLMNTKLFDRFFFQSRKQTKKENTRRKNEEKTKQNKTEGK